MAAGPERQSLHSVLLVTVIVDNLAATRGGDDRVHWYFRLVPFLGFEVVAVGRKSSGILDKEARRPAFQGSFNL